MTVHPDLSARPPPPRDRWVSPYQLSVVRLIVALFALVYLGFLPLEVPLDAQGSNAWLELPRVVRGSLRLAGFALSALLLAGWMRRPAALLLLNLLAITASYGRLDPLVAGTLGVSLVAALSQGGDDPLALAPFSGNRGAAPVPVPYFSQLIWPWLSLPIAGALLPQGAVGGVFALALVAGAAFMATRGTDRRSAVVLVSAWAIGLVFISGPYVLPLWLPLFLLCLSRDWLPPRTVVLPPNDDSTALDDPDPPVVFYDGVCGLCQATVQLLVAEDRDARLMYAPLQGETAQRLLGVSPNQESDSLKLYDAGVIYERSTGALRIASYLGGFWTAVSWCEHIPPAVRDAAYNFVGKNRYAWFGKLDACRIPTPSERKRFLD